MSEQTDPKALTHEQQRHHRRATKLTDAENALDEAFTHFAGPTGRGKAFDERTPPEIAIATVLELMSAQLKALYDLHDAARDYSEEIADTRLESDGNHHTM